MKTLGVLLFSLFSTWAVAEDPAANESTSLVDVITQYMNADSQDAEKTALAEAVKSSNGIVSRVTEAVDKVKLWKQPDSLKFGLPLPGTQQMLRVVLPDEYDPANRYPVILTVGDVNLPADLVEPFAQIRVPVGLFPQFHEAYEVRPAEWLAELRRAVHINEDRVFLVGEGLAGDRGLLTLIRQPGMFAGGAFWQSTLDVPYANVLGPMLLEQLEGRPVVLGWDHKALESGRATDGRELMVALVNELLVSRGPEMSGAVEPVLSEDGESFWRGEAVADLLDGRRLGVSQHVKRYRFAEEAIAGGVRLTGVAGPGWEGDVIDIAVANGVADGAGFIRGILEEKFGLLRVTVEGQRISVEMSGAREVEISLGCDCIDFDKPVTIMVNGKRRFEGRVRASIQTILKSAKRTWSFQRPVCARMRIGSRGDGRQF